MPPKSNGMVQLVGAGPGAADLLTLRALRAIEAADIVLIDALVGADVRALIPSRVRVIDVGKRAHRPSPSQDFINRLMARYAKAGARVVRLKGGDPSLFGRVAEERAFLEKRGVAVEVIPGVTSASAAAAQFNFSLTERGAARRVLFATGRTVSGAELDWRAAADAQTTLCLYMGCAQIEAITQQLIAAGRAPDTPTLAAIDVERPGARQVQCALSELPRALAHIGQESPVLIVVGEVSAAARRRHPIRDQGAQPDIPASPIWRSSHQCGGSKSVALANPPSRICRKGKRPDPHLPCAASPHTLGPALGPSAGP